MDATPGAGTVGILGVKMNLHGQIMNLGAVEPDEYADGPVRTAYRVGHRDARHAAAELALKADAELDALRKDAARLEWLLDNALIIHMRYEVPTPSTMDRAGIDAARGQP